MSDPVDIRGWQRLDERTTTSGRIEPDDVARLKAIGVAHVINLALDDHPDALEREADRLGAHAIGYTHVPIPFDAPTEVHYAAFRDAVEAADGPLHVHCIMNWRVSSALFYRLNRGRGMLEAEARALLQKQWDPLASTDPHANPWAALMAGPDVARAPALTGEEVEFE